MSKYKEYSALINSVTKYPTPTDLIYKHKFTHDELKELNVEKFKDSKYVKLNLYDEVTEPVIYLNSDYFTNKLTDSEDLILNSNINKFSNIEDEELVNGFIFSEIESSLAIEGVKSTRAKIEKINTLKYSDLKSQNEIIVKNMLEAYSFVRENNITEVNIFNLYQIISSNCLSDDKKLLKDNYYRHDEVNIIGLNERIVDKGVSSKKLKKMMNDLILFINEEKSNEELLLAPHIIHYYLVYLHPYFDYNGRMARVLSYWYTIKHIPSFSLLFISEAINNNKNKNRYYTAIKLSRKTNNDITYFIEYISDIILEYSMLYINYYNIINKLKGNGKTINRSLQVALENVLAIPKIGDGFFDWKEYKSYSSSDFSKVQYFKLLNSLTDLKILTLKQYKNTNLYKLNSKKWDLLIKE
ncbi:MAG: Fic/DOC family protein [Candidatus Izimaplasma bacterium HR2]|nr:MAG: Fic/DOC family protein [Candidatus Izimaplasma bacterium HR2]